jgi:hypothetical protein
LFVTHLEIGKQFIAISQIDQLDITHHHHSDSDGGKLGKITVFDIKNLEEIYEL